MADSRRRRTQAGRKTAPAPSSSFFGTIKGFVTAPLTWFASSDTDEFEDDRDEMGKRRRQAAATTESADKDGPTPSKRQRVRSPDSDGGMQPAYLDPPTTAFPQQSQRAAQFSPRRNVKSINLTQVPNVSSGMTVGPNAPRVLSPLRKQFSRNMNIDNSSQNAPRLLSRDVSMKSIGTLSREVSMEPLGIRRDNSMPPLSSSKPSFKMRSSLTPQLTRETSEPPPVSSLKTKPMFVHPPAGISRKPSMTLDTAVTLGSLADNSRRTMSPVRQHSSLFTSNAAPPRSASPYETDVQRTIQELDVYKTPLVPSRLRKAASGSTQNLTSSGYGGPTDMFRSKKGLILMNDERKSPHLGKKSRKGKDKERNGTKPYAGEGGMKRLLARRKKETQDDTNADNVRESVSSVSEEPIETKPMPPPEVPLLPPSGKEVFAPISSAAMKQAGSSLRVGRTLTSRTHISRPQPSKLKFSASFDDDDDAMDENERENEIRAIDEASKRAPTFSVPNGFSFAKDVAPISHDSSNAKEPPVTSLPFSLSSGHSSTTSSARSTPLVFGASSSKINTPSDSLPPLSSIPPSALRSDPAPVTEKGIPDFFSKSRYVTDAPKEDRSSSIYTDAAPPPISAVFNAVPPGFSEELKQVNNDNLTEDTGKKPDTAFSFERKTKDIVANPFQTLAPPSSSLFNFGAATASKTESNGAQLDLADVKPEVVSLFGVPSASVDKPAIPSLSSDKPVEEAPSSVFTFGKAPSSSSSDAPPIQTSSLFGTKPADPAPSLFSNPSSEPKPFTFGSGSASNDAKPAEKSLFGGSAPIEPPPSTVSLFGRTASDTANPASTTLFGNTTGEAPKSLFGSSAPQSTPFMFGQPSKELEKPTAPAAFAFGVSSTTPDETKKDAPFSFSQSAPSPAPASTGFSFGASTPTDASRTFSFGSRPVTPPNVGQDEDSMGMDQSPTRDVTPKVNEVRPTLNTGASLGFTFGASAPPFGQPQSATSTTSVASPFSFGGTTSNPPAFGAKLEEPKPSFGFGHPSSNAPPAFGFGKPAAAEPEPPRPNTAGSFGFASPSSTNAPAPSFAFGAGGGSNFGGSQASSSAPSSPSLNHQPAPAFSFGGAPAQPSNPFGFGSSQPASPATPTTPLPQFGGFGANPPSSPFGGNASLPGTNGASAGGNAFTIGAAPSDTRPIRRMPRRGGKR